jgi:hypothetical protein
MSLFQWENIDHSLVSLKLTDLAEKMHSEIRLEEERIRFANRHNLNDNAIPSLVLRMKHERADECARKAYEIYCSPADRKTQSTSLNYRSELKRAVALLLIKDPNVSDLNISRGLDADGAVELPQSLTGDGQRRLFIAAYKDPRYRHRLEVTFSRVRKDMRDRGLLGKKAI